MTHRLILSALIALVGIAGIIADWPYTWSEQARNHHRKGTR